MKYQTGFDIKSGLVLNADGPPAGGRCQVFGQYLKKVSPLQKVKPLKPIQCKISNVECRM